jgi:ribulose-phosphate 3-epimerase
MVGYLIAPSLLAADFARLGEQVAAIEKDADLLHLDVMDGHFVPNISFGVPVIRSLRPLTSLVFDCHVMTTNPDQLLPTLAEAGCDLVTVHIEAVPDPSEAAAIAKALDMRFGLVLSPPTPFAAVEPFIELCDMVVIMSVQPGKGGQTFDARVLDKVTDARNWIESHELKADIQIDGGISPATIGVARDAGANVFVAGTAVFGNASPSEAIRDLRRVVEGET